MARSYTPKLNKRVCMPETEKPENEKIVLHPMLSDEEAAAIAKETLKNLVLEYKPGQMVGSQGIYFGQYKPKDRKGNRLGKTFNVFAAPQDLPETMKYVDAVKHIAKLKGWNGFDGTNYPTDKEIYAALKDGSYKGGWIIPTRELLAGTEPDDESDIREGKVIQPDNLFNHQNKGAFKGTFKTAASSGSAYPGWYWSSTEYRENQSDVWGVRFSDGCGGWNRKDDLRLSCRPVRLVPA